MTSEGATLAISIPPMKDKSNGNDGAEERLVRCLRSNEFGQRQRSRRSDACNLCLLRSNEAEWLRGNRRSGACNFRTSGEATEPNSNDEKRRRRANPRLFLRTVIVRRDASFWQGGAGGGNCFSSH
ncbi:hypothetical protein MA16_Dca005305 [Dendrobium catenatum]|uniref:Uncharacterized protein n=1 Tax=Dendrobium catenatum TaxID=906689 RepID=A0A2I0VLU6_9ASPA|nr:hypothetical protein MA16_Dca005305 [Dendrobium catenatum]